MAVLSADRSTWTELKLKLPYKAQVSGAAYLNGEIYLLGGDNKPKALYKLDKIMKWKPLTDMNVARRFIASSCFDLNGDIWAVGGRGKGNESCLNSVEKYDLMENVWMNMR